MHLFPSVGHSVDYSLIRSNRDELDVAVLKAHRFLQNEVLIFDNLHIELRMFALVGQRDARSVLHDPSGLSGRLAGIVLQNMG